MKTISYTMEQTIVSCQDCFFYEDMTVFGEKDRCSLDNNAPISYLNVPDDCPCEVIKDEVL